MIQFNATYLKHLRPFMGANDPRFYLNVVHITPHKDGGAILIATNGYCMMCIRAVDAICEAPANIFITADAAKYGVKRPRASAPICTVATDTQRLTISDGDSGDELYLQPGKCLPDHAGPGRVDGYIDWKRVMPNFERLKPGGAGAIQTKYQRMAADAHPLSSRYMPAVRFWQHEPHSALVVEFCDAPEFMLLILPVRDKGAPDRAIGYWDRAFPSAKIAPTIAHAATSQLEPA